MTDKIEYLEKYSVAPSPSRDYYGIKVLRDEVILFLWKISHGPHRTPTIKVTKFSDFDDDKSLQDEIQRIFGDYLLEHVRKIASGKEITILTLPKNIIAIISRYLRFKDIINLSTLSRASKEIFDNDIVWETLYRKYKKSKISKEEKQFVMASSWKQLLKDKQLQESIRNQKPPKIFQSTIKERSKQSGINLASVKNSNSLSNSKKFTEDPKKLSNIDNNLLKLSSEKKKNNLDSISINKISKESKIKLKIDPKEKELKNRSQLTVNKDKTEKINFLTKPKSSISLKSFENLKSKKSSVSKSNQIPDSKLQNKEIGKSKKIIENKFTTLKTDKNLLNNFHGEDISALIEESLKNFKNPRSIFDYDFSVLENEKSGGDSKFLSPRLDIKNLKKESIHVEGISKVEKNERESDDDSDLDISHFTKKYLNARSEFVKKMSEASNLKFLKAKGLHNSLSGEFQKPLNTIPENLKKLRASIFENKKVECKNLIQDKSKISTTRRKK